MKHPVLNAEPRTVLGKQVKKLRREGILPANIYGKSLASQSLQVKLSDFENIYNQAGETGVVDLTVKDKIHPVLIKNLQINYSSNTPLHADFYQVNLKEKVKTMVPVALIGDPKAVTEKIGVLLQTLSEVEIEALPDRIPENIEVNVEPLSEVGAGITVADLKVGEGVAILTDSGLTIARISEPQKEEVVVVPEETPAEGEAPPGGATAAQGATETKAEEKGEKKASEEKPQKKQEK